MANAALVIGAALDGKQRAALWDVVIEKAQQACWVDLVAGAGLALFYGMRLFGYGPTLHAGDLVPLIGALAITRAGDTLKTVAYWAFHKPGETAAHGD